MVGPTAAGKTDVGVEIARAFGGEVVNADSRLFCRGFDIGTAKPSTTERKGVPHHLIDILEPGETLGLRAYLDLASATIAAIAGREKLPVVVGGTGQYLWGLLEGWDVSRLPPDAAFRASLEREAAEHGAGVLAERLKREDPEAAARIDSRNVRRVIRALELARARQARRSASQAAGELRGGAKKASRPPYDALVIGLTLPREELYRRIDERIDRMFAAGWADEVKRLLDNGVAPGAPCMGGIGYPAVVAALKGEIPLVEAVRRAKHDTRRLVRHQYNWFRLSDPRIHWLDAGAGVTEGASGTHIADRAIEAVRVWVEQHS